MKSKARIFIAFILNFLFSAFELIGGLITGSVAIMSDAVHDFCDSVSIGIAYLFEKISNKKTDKKYSYGYARFSVLGGLITTFILLISSIIVVYNAILRIITPVQINYNFMIIFAVFGFMVNLLATYFTHGGKSINQRAVNLHMLEDVLGWLVVLIGAIVMKFTNFYIVDPILSIAIAIFILFNSVKFLVQISHIFLMKTPKNINLDELISHIQEIDGVIGVHHIHVWSIDGESHCATLHVVLREFDSNIKKLIKEELKEHGISHITIEIETEQEECLERYCVIEKSANHGHHCHHNR